MKISDSLVDLNDGVFEVMMIKMPKTLMDLSAIVTSLTSLNPLKYDPFHVFIPSDKGIEDYF